MTHGSLFSDIGGFDLAAEWMGWTNVFQVEIDKFCNKVLEKNFPNVKRYGDIKEFDGTQYRGAVDVLSGGFPCQPYSTAGKRKGKDDDRHLWPEMLRAIIQVQPSWIVGENVPGLLNWKRGMVLYEIKTDLESEGFEVFPPCLLPACGLNANHKRERLWIIAHSDGFGKRSIRSGNTRKNTQEIRIQNSDGFTDFITEGITTYANGSGQQERRSQRFTPIQFAQDNRPTSEPGICGRINGISNRVDRLRPLGNAIVPQVAYEIFKAIEQTNDPDHYRS